MPSNDSFEFDYTPGYQKPTHEYGAPYGDEFHAEVVYELLLSMQGYTQRGITLAAGQGMIPTGTILARCSGNGKWYQYSSGATDGRGVALGVLRDSRDTGGSGYASLAAYNSASSSFGGWSSGVTLAGGAITVFPASPAGKTAADCQANLVYRGILNANLVSGTDTISLVSGTGGGVSTPLLATLGARVMPFGAPQAGAAFPGGPMDGEVGSPAGLQLGGQNAFIF
jgi:Bacteriophage lambda head decoration protein D